MDYFKAMYELGKYDIGRHCFICDEEKWKYYKKCKHCQIEICEQCHRKGYFNNHIY